MAATQHQRSRRFRSLYHHHRQQPHPTTIRTTAAVAADPAQLAAIAVEPVAEVAVLAAAGALCARQGLLTLQSRRMLSGLVMNVFTPSLLFSKLGASVDVQLALHLWPLAANMLACHIAGLGLGWLQVKTLARTPASLARPVIVMTALGNVGNLPLTFIPALLSKPGVLQLISGSADSSSSSGSLSGSSAAAALADVAAATDLGITYVMLGFFCASFIQFPLGYLLLQHKPDAEDQQWQQQVAPSGELAAAEAAAGSGLLNAAAAAAAAAAEGPSAVAASSSSTIASLPGKHQQQQAQQQQQPLQQPPGAQAQQQQVQQLLRGIFTPPVIACLISIPVASLPSLKTALFDPGGDLRWLGDAIGLLGAPLIPTLFLTLGANLADGPGSAQVPTRTLVGLLVSKLMLHPLLGTAGITVASQAGLLPDTDALMVLVMLLVWCTPTAVLTHSLATMLQNGEDQGYELLHGSSPAAAGPAGGPAAGVVVRGVLSWCAALC